jgi:hypothetical protein
MYKECEMAGGGWKIAVLWIAYNIQQDRLQRLLLAVALWLLMFLMVIIVS